MIIQAPFDNTTVARIRKYQNNPVVHPYTCTNGHTLSIDKEGLKCHTCDYKQTWIHSSSIQEGIYNMKSDFGMNEGKLA